MFLSHPTKAVMTLEPLNSFYYFRVGLVIYSTKAPKTKASTAKFLLGQPDSMLKEDFLQAIQLGKEYDDIQPWLGPLQLPTVEQVLKLYYYLREMEGKKNRWVYRAEVVNMVAGQVVKLWDMAGFQTVKMYNVVKSLTKEVEKYELIQKARSKTS